jgi:hypothetical protein
MALTITIESGYAEIKFADGNILRVPKKKFIPISSSVNRIKIANTEITDVSEVISVVDNVKTVTTTSFSNLRELDQVIRSAIMVTRVADPPVYSSGDVGTINSTTLEITFNQTLSSDNVDGTYTLTASGGSATLSNPVIVAGKLQLTISRAIANTETLTFSYTSTGTNPLQNNAGDTVENITTASVTNNVSLPLGPERITDPSFEGDGSAYSYSNPPWVIANGEATATNANSSLKQAGSPDVVGETYRLEFDCLINGGKFVAYVYDASCGSITTSGHYVFDKVSSSSSWIFDFYCTAQDFSGKIYNVSVKKVLASSPAFSSGEIGTIDNSTVEVTFSASLDTGKTDGTHTLTASGGAVTLSSPTIVGGKLQLTTSRVIDAGETLTYSYTNSGANPLQDVSANEVQTFTNKTIVNNCSFTMAFSSGEVGTLGSNIVDISFNSALADGKTDGTHVIASSEGAVAISSYYIFNGNLRLELDRNILSTESLTYDYTNSGTDPLQNANGDQVATIGTPEALTNNSTYAFSTETNTYLTALTSAPDIYQKIKLNEFINKLNNVPDGGTIDHFQIYAGHSDSGSQTMINVMNPGTGDGTLVNAPTFTANQGYKGNGTDQHIRTGYIPSTYSGATYLQNDASIIVYELESTSGVAYATGVATGSGRASIIPYYNDRFYGELNQAGGLQNVGTTISTTPGSTISSRNSSTGYDVYRNGIKTDSFTVTSNGVPSKEFYVMTSNVDGNPSSNRSNRMISMVGFGSGLTDNAAAYIHNAMAEFMGSATVESFVQVNGFSVEDTNPNKWILTTGEEVNITDATGVTLNINGSAATITNVSGSGTQTIEFTTTQTVSEGDVLTYKYDNTIGNIVATSDGTTKLINVIDLSDVVNNVVDSAPPPSGNTLIDESWESGIFVNNGSPGWRNNNFSQTGNITEVVPTYSLHGSNSLHLRAKDYYRCEIVRNGDLLGQFEFDKEYWIGIAYRLGSQYANSDYHAWSTLLQLHSVPSTWQLNQACIDLGVTYHNSGQNGLSIHMKRRELRFHSMVYTESEALNTIPDAAGVGPVDSWQHPDAIVPTGVWHKFVINFKTSYTSAGFIKMWYNDELKVNQIGPNIHRLDACGEPKQLKTVLQFGIYKERARTDLDLDLWVEGPRVGDQTSTYADIAF